MMRHARAIFLGIGASATVGLMLSLADQSSGHDLGAAATAYVKAMAISEPNALGRLPGAASVNYAGAFSDYSSSADWMQVSIPVAESAVAADPTPPAHHPATRPVAELTPTPPVHPPASTEIVAGLRSYAPPASLDTAPPHALDAWPLAFR